METTNIIPVLLAGGSGTRLWPLSRQSYPKQFSNLIGEHSLFQKNALRLSSSETVSFDKHLILTNSEFRFIVTEQLYKLGIDPGDVIIEPSSKNTGPAILAACMYYQKKDPNAIFLVAPSDHLISDTYSFHQSIKLGLAELKNGSFITFGIKPTRPETGFGYLELERPISSKASRLKKFLEKPASKVAAEIYKCDNYLWNTGIFLFRVKDMLSAFELLASESILPVRDSIEKGVNDLGFFRLQPESWDKCKDISVDFAIMEKVNNAVAIKLDCHWSDLGSWESVANEMESDKNGVCLSKNAHAIDCNDTLLRSESTSQEIVGIGLRNIIAISMPDAVLVADKDCSNKTKMAVDILKEKGISQATEFPKHHRPWGWYELLSTQDRYQVKRLYINAGGCLSLQKHYHRSEHWIMVKGTIKVTLDKETRVITEGESVYVPLGIVHRIENPGKLPAILIEIQTGSYLNEDDIVRYDDIYARDK